MKVPAVLFVLLCFSRHSFSQNVMMQLADLDSAYAHADYSKAKKLITVIYPSAGAITNDTVLVEFLGMAGTVYYHTKNFEKAALFFQETAELAKRKLGSAEYHYPLALFNLASCYKEQGNFITAEPLYLQSLPGLATAFGQNTIEYTRCFYTLATLYIDMGRYKEAESMCAAAVNAYKTALGDTSADYLGALGAMGLIYQETSRYGEAEQIYLSLKTYHESQPVPSIETLQVLNNNLGALYRYMNDYDRSALYLNRAIAMAGDSSESAASALNNLALVQKATGNYSGAEQSYKKAIRIYILLGKSNHPDYTNPVNNLGELYRTMGRLQEAVFAFEEVIELRRKLLGTDHPNYANAVNNLALVEFAIGHYSDAEKHMLECRDIYKRTLGDKHAFYANSLNNLASVYKATGQLSLAEGMYKECLKIYRENFGATSDKYGIYLGGLAATYRMLKRYDEAISLTLQSLSILKNKLGVNHYDYIETQYHLAETYREAGKLKEAQQNYLKATDGYLLLIRKYFPYLSENDKTSFYYAVAGAFETFNSFVIDMHRLQPTVAHDSLVMQVYKNQVALKSLLLRESEQVRTKIMAGNNEALKQDYLQWLKMREQIVQQYRLPADELAVASINVNVLELQANELEQRLSINSNAGIPQGVISWQEISAALRQNEYAVEIIRTDYYEKGRWTDTVFYAAIIISNTSKAPQWILLSAGKDLETTKLSNYRRTIKLKTEDELSYNAYWEPIKKYCRNASNIFLSTDGVYQQLNLYTLKNPVTSEYLINENNITLVTNTRDILRKKSLGQSATASIFSFPDYGAVSTQSANTNTRQSGFPDLKELPGTKVESDSVKKILTSHEWSVKEFSRKKATENEIKKVESPGILHIATHGFFLKDVSDNMEEVFGIRSAIAKDNPLLRSGLILAGAAAIAKDTVTKVTDEDGILTAYEAIGLNLTHTELVVLSACETGLGELTNGQGVYGLQRAFLLAGAKSVIMSLWVIDDFATQELMTHFYREWLNDPSHDKPAALKRAQLQLKEKYPAPYYWGAFVLVGD